MKILSLAFLGLVAVKAVAGLVRQGSEGEPRRLRSLRGAIYSLILTLIILGARYVGYDVAAELYLWASERNLARGEYAKAYSNAVRGVELRPANFRYWRNLALNKLTLRQYASLLDDMPAFLALSGGELDEEDAYKFAACYLFSGQHDKVIPLTRRLIGLNRMFAAPYILLGKAYTAQKKYEEAERTYLAILRLFPSHQAAVEGLAHVYFLAGNRAGAISVLNETAKYPFPPEARKRFEALKALYEQ